MSEMANQQAYTFVSLYALCFVLLLLRSWTPCWYHGKVLSALEIQPTAGQLLFGSSAETATVDFAITQLEVGGCRGTIDCDPVTHKMDEERAAPKKLHLMLQKSLFVIMENLMLLCRKKNVNGKQGSL